MPLKPLRLLSFLALGLLLSCSSTEPIAAPLGTFVSSDKVVLLNQSNIDLYFLIADPEFLALADFAFCASPAACANVHVPPFGTRSVPFDSIAGYDARTTKTLEITQWRFEMTLSGYARTDEQFFGVKLK